MLDLEVHDAEVLFDLLDNNADGELCFEEFLKGVTRLKGQARSMDIVAMLRAHDQTHADLLKVFASMEAVHTKICEMRSVQGLGV